MGWEAHRGAVRINGGQIVGPEEIVARIATLERELAEAREVLTAEEEENAQLSAAVAKLVKERDRLREALCYFAHFPSGGKHIDPDQPIEVTTTSRDIQRAKQALAGGEAE